MPDDVRQIEVGVSDEHIREYARVRKPVAALSELIWNALDADAENVVVDFQRNALGGLDQIIISDDGTGISPEDAQVGFEELGKSWKQRTRATRSKQRLLHGQGGKGRFRAFALGGSVEWKSITSSARAGYRSISISGTSLTPRRFTIRTFEAADTPTPGTKLTIANPIVSEESLAGEDAVGDLLEQFALYLMEYPSVNVRIGSSRLDPTQLVKDTHKASLPGILVSGKKKTADLWIIGECQDSCRKNIHAAALASVPTEAIV